MIWSSNDENDVSFQLYVFEIRYQKDFTAAHPTKKEFKISEVIPAGANGFALKLKNKLISNSSEGQRHSILIW